MTNPAFNSDAFKRPGQTAVTTPSSQELDELYARPSATGTDTDRMTVEDVVLKGAISFGLLAVGAVLGWAITPVVPALMIVAGIVGFVLAMVNIFKKQPSRPLILAYAAAQGLFVGGLSFVFEQMQPGIVMPAVVATLAVVGVTLVLFANGKIRASKRATKIFMVAMVGYLAFSLVNFGLQIFGVTDDPFGLRGEVILFGIPLGVILGVLAVLLGAYSLVLDFDFVQRGVANGAPRSLGWRAVFGIMLTVVWLYIEILRLIAIARE